MVKYIKCIAEAWDILHRKHSLIIQSSFRRVGLSLPIDGSCDHALSVKNIPSDVLHIGDWAQDLEDTTIDGAETGDENVEFNLVAN